MQPHLDLTTLPPAVLVVLAVLGVAQLALDVIALVSLVRRPRAAVAFGNKWIWVAIILLVNTVGAILYLAIGRKPAAPEEQSVSAVSKRTPMSSVANSLYGERESK